MKNNERCPWTIWDVLIFIVLIAAFIFNDPFHIGARVLQFLRLRFFIFTKEPKLLYYMAVYINTIILKLLSIILLVVIVRLRKATFLKATVPIGKIPSWRTVYLPLYLALCVVLYMFGSANPVVMNIPFNSVFIEAKVIGNIVIIFSVLLVAPFVEEVLFRGFLYPALNKYIGMYPAIGATALLFTLAHYPQVKEDLKFAFVILILGLVISYARARTGSTVVAIIMHHLYNLTCIVLGVTSYVLLGY